MATVSKRQVKAWQRFNDDLNAFILESEGEGMTVEATLYEEGYENLLRNRDMVEKRI